MLLGDGFGGFAAAVPYATGNFPRRTTLSTQDGQTAVATADLDGNGLADIITSQLDPPPP